METSGHKYSVLCQVAGRCQKVNTISDGLTTYSFSSGIGNCCPSKGHNHTNLQAQSHQSTRKLLPSRPAASTQHCAWHLSVSVNVHCIELCSLVVTPSRYGRTTWEILIGQEVLAGCWRSSEVVKGRERAPYPLNPLVFSCYLNNKPDCRGAGADASWWTPTQIMSGVLLLI